MNLWQDFKTNDQKLIHKWVHYFPIYERHLAPFRNRTITVLEIGVFKGGSLQMWQRFLGPMATIVGIDINPECKQHEEPGIHVRIGDQSDPQFLQSLIDEFGTFDIVIDDGSHRMQHLLRSFEFLYPRIAKNGLYIAEDLHTCYWPEYGGGLDQPDSFVNVSKSLVDKLNADHSRGQVPQDFFARHTFGISFYDSVIVFERGTIPFKAAPTIGRG
ncbi:class I SAM-dependent methyltransferase [Roseateles sp. LKC17W]|uniref:Class I SAM-dependent methyltransferase n=1 Tax=Pelomonas margarita TaxID=3299031 RepID=A0ABW7FCC1_9BURK